MGIEAAAVACTVTSSIALIGERDLTYLDDAEPAPLCVVECTGGSGVKAPEQGLHWGEQIGYLRNQAKPVMRAHAQLASAAWSAPMCLESVAVVAFTVNRVFPVSTGWLSRTAAHKGRMSRTTVHYCSCMQAVCQQRQKAVLWPASARLTLCRPR